MSKKFLFTSLFLLGLAALIFQVAILNKLMLIFGLTAPAVATVLTVYFVGMALGSFLFGKLADKHSEKLKKLYLLTTAIVAVYGLLIPFLFIILNKLIYIINSAVSLNFAGFNFYAFILSIVFLIIPTIAIGGVIPLASKLLITKENRIGKDMGALYAIYTFGGVFGVVLCGFFLIPQVGTTASLVIGAIFSIIGGAIIYFNNNINIIESKDAEESNDTPVIKNKIFVTALFITGFLGLSLEVFYTKTLILFIGSSTYAFSIILIVFLSGIALGSWLITPFIKKIAKQTSYFGILLGLIGFWLFILINFFENLPFIYKRIFESFGSFDFSVTLAAQFVLVALAMLPVALLMGAVFPLAIKLAAPSIKSIGQGIGKIYMLNTFGGALGSLITGFFFLPLLGYQKTIIIILAIYFILGAVFVAKDKELNKVIKIILSAFFVLWVAFSIFLPAWHKGYLSLGVFPYMTQYASLNEEALKKGAQQEKILFYSEGLSNIAVIQRGGEVLMRVNGKTDAGSSLTDLEHEIMTGVLPLLFHEKPDDVLVVGLGSGITLGSITQFDEIKNIDVVEIDPAIVKAAEKFKDFNHDALTDPRVNTYFADGRNYIALTDKKYDVISSQPSNIWVSGNAYLFTKEYYELAKERLNDDGLMLQWVQLYSLNIDDVKVILKTFASVFPGTYVFQSASGGDLFLIGKNDKESLNFDVVEEKYKDKKVLAEISRLYLWSPYLLGSYFIASGDEMKSFYRNSSIHKDSRPFLEFSAPKSIYKNTAIKNLRTLKALHEDSDISKSIIAKDSEKLDEYFYFANDLFEVKGALGAGDIFSAVNYYKKAKELKLDHPLIEAYIMRWCTILAQLQQNQYGKEASDKVWEKCKPVFNHVETGGPN